MIREGKYRNWEEITPFVNRELFGDHDEEYRGESAYRKSVKYARDYYDAGVFNVSDDDYIREVENQRRELEKERQKLNTTKVEYGRYIRQQSRFELFYENIASGLKAFELPEFDLLYQENSLKCHILTIADIHAGANFSIDSNQYSLEECGRRFEILLSAMVDYVQTNAIRRLKTVCLGDSIQGMLRISDLALNESTVVAATVFVAQAIAHFLRNLSKYCEIEYYHVPSSNHSQLRPLGTKASELAAEDIEYIIGNYIRDVLADNPRISVNLNFGHEYIEIPILNFNTIAMHGHQISNIENSLKNFCYQRKRFYDAVFLAHYHGGKETVVGETQAYHDTEVLVCPSFIGTCPYAERIFKGAKPSCKVFVFDEKYGHTDSHKIILK